MLTRYLFSHALTVLTSIASIAVAFRLLSLRRSPQSLLAWLLALAFLPFLALPLYFLLGVRKFPRTAKMPARGGGPAGLGHMPRDVHPVRRVLATTTAPPAREGNSFSLLATGEIAYARLLQLIAEAKTSLHVTVFIVGDDATGRAVMGALAKRAREGIDVRVIVDAVGSREVFGRARKMLVDAGAELRHFMPLLHAPVRGRTNLRCHRKLVVADGHDVFCGGMNFALEYMGEAPLDTRWRDVAAMASGPVAADVEALFDSDWAFCGGTEDAPTRKEATVSAGGAATLQLLPSGPDMRDDTFYDAISTAIACARERVTIVTPYYVPDAALQYALILAARRGVRTQLVLPAKSNHALADFARRAFVRELREAGVTIRAYGRGMVHAKAMIVDDDFAYLGSPNFDMRSLFLNYESALCVYDRDAVAQVGGWIDALAAECADDPLQGRRAHWFLERVAQLLAPEL